MPMELPENWHLHVDDILEHLLDENIAQARHAKEELVANGPADLEAMFCWYLSNGHHLPVPLGKISDFSEMHPVNILEMMIPQIRAKSGEPPILAVLGYEAWTHHKGEGDKPIPEDEAVIMIAATPRRAIFVCMPFSYGDGSVVWGDTYATRMHTHELVQYGDMASALWACFVNREAN